MAAIGAAKPAIQHKGSFRRLDGSRKTRRAPGGDPRRAPASAQRVPVTLRHAGPPISGRIAQVLANWSRPRSEGTHPVAASGAASRVTFSNHW